MNREPTVAWLHFDRIREEFRQFQMRLFVGENVTASFILNDCEERRAGFWAVGCLKVVLCKILKVKDHRLEANMKRV